MLVSKLISGELQQNICFTLHILFHRNVKCMWLVGMVSQFPPKNKNLHYLNVVDVMKTNKVKFYSKKYFWVVCLVRFHMNQLKYLDGRIGVC